MKVRLKGNKFIHGTTARVDDVQDAVENEGKLIEAAASALLSAHRDNADAQHHSISGGKNYDAEYGELDYEITLSGPAAMSLEFGHGLYVRGKATGHHVKGLHILYKSAGLM